MIGDFAPSLSAPAYPQRYGNRTVAIHWTTTSLVLFVFVLGLTIDSFPKKYASGALNIHALFGLSIFFISAVRVAFRKASGQHIMEAQITRLARFGHLALYFCLLAVPLIGIPALLFRGHGFDLGLFEVGPFFARNRELARILTQTHLYAAYFFAVLVLGHVSAVFLHTAIWKDGTLQKMLPSRRTMGVSPTRNI